MTKIKYFSLISIIFSLLIAPNIAFGAASLSEDIQLELGTSIAADKPITAEIDVPSIIQLDEGFIISGENSYALEDQKLVYYWIIDGVRLSDHSSQILWRFSDPGEHVVELEISDGKKRSKTKEDIQVYQDTAIIFGKTWDPQQKGKLRLVSEFAKSQSWYLQNQVADQTETFSSSLYNSTNSIESHSILFFWMLDSASIDALTEFARNQRDLLHGKTFIFISDQNQYISAQLIKNIYDILDLKDMYLLQKDDVHVLFDKTNTDFSDILSHSEVEYIQIDERIDRFEGWNVLSFLVSRLIQNGVSMTMLSFILVLPLLAFLVTIFRQVIGISTLGIVLPVILPVVFMSIGLANSLIILVYLLLVAIVSRVLVKKLNLLYVPRTAMILGITVLSIIFLLAAFSYFGLTMLNSLSVLPFLILLFVVDRFLLSTAQEWVNSALLSFIQTLFVSLVSYAIIASFSSLGTVLLIYPEISLLSILLNIVIGHYTGLRLSEYIRFRSIFLKEEEE